MFSFMTISGHSMFRASNNDQSDSLMEDIHTGEVPIYMDYFQEIMIHLKIDPKSQRTFFWVVTNAERKLDNAFSVKILRSGYEKSGQGVCDFRTQLDHWPWSNMLTEEDFLIIERNFDSLLQISKSQGTIYPEVGNIILGDFIYEKHNEYLMPEALVLLINEEMKKPVRDRPENQAGTLIMTNPGHREDMQRKAIALQEVKERKMSDRY